MIQKACHPISLHPKDRKDLWITVRDELFRERTCFRCHKEIQFKDYLETNSTHENTFLENFPELARVWQSDHVEIFCCHCFQVVPYHLDFLNEEERSI